MLKQNFVINHPDGLYVGAAGVLIKGMTPFKSNVTINYNGRSINGKSLLSIMSVYIKCGEEIELVIDGEDEAAAMNCATALFESGLKE